MPIFWSFLRKPLWRGVAPDFFCGLRFASLSAHPETHFPDMFRIVSILASSNAVRHPFETYAAVLNYVLRMPLYLSSCLPELGSVSPSAVAAQYGAAAKDMGARVGHR